MASLNKYLNFSYPVDLRQMVTMADIHVSQALGTSLVRMGPEGSVVAGLAKSWSIGPGEKFIDFKIDPMAKWSDGSPLTVAEIISSFRDTKAHFHKSLASMFDSYSHMEAVESDTLRIHLQPGVTPAAFLPKLVEPMYGIIKLVNWSASLEVTSGPYSVKFVDQTDLILKINPHWLFYSQKMIPEIHLRRSQDFVNASTLLEDTWPHLVNLMTGVTKQELAKLPPDYVTFTRRRDRLLNLRYTGHGDLEGARILFAFLRAHADFEKLAGLLVGGLPTQQMYPTGHPLHGQNPSVSQVTVEQLRAAWKKPSLTIAYSFTRLQPEIKDAFQKLLRAALPFAVEFVGLGIEEVNAVHLSRKYDFLFGSVGVDADNLDGSMAYFIEQQPVHLPSDKTAKGNFIARLKEARRDPRDQADAFRKILFDAVDENYFLPLVHFSTTFIARRGVDFSQISECDDNVPFAALRRGE